jgi:hypothetical protein
MSTLQQRWVQRSPYFIFALLLHLVLFLMIATWVIFAPPPSPLQYEFHTFTISPPPPKPLQPPAPAGSGAMNPTEPDLVVTPPPQTPSVIVSQNNLNFNLSAPKVKLPNLTASMTQPQGSGLDGHGAGSNGFGGGAGGFQSPFGSTKNTGVPVLTGYMYDLKQTPDGKPSSVTPDTYCSVIDDFLAKQWDDQVLGSYYRFGTPIYATQIFIPAMDAGLGPKTFGAQDKIQPTCWVIHYRVKVSPPLPGTYRFWGTADDLIAVAADGRTVLVGGRPDMIQNLSKQKWRPTAPDGAQAADDALRPGRWMTFEAGDTVTLDIIIGERPGGEFNAFLMVEKQGDTYQKDGQGHPILPIFRVAEKKTPATDDLNQQPLFSTDAASIWTPQTGN